MELDGVVGRFAPLRRSFVVRVILSAVRLDPADGADASEASGLAGCVGGNGGRGVVAHPADRAAIAKNKEVREMNMVFSVFVSFHFRCLLLRNWTQRAHYLNERHDAGARARLPERAIRFQATK
jgi:hypothetical protein